MPAGIFKFQDHYTVLFCKNRHIIEALVVYL